MKSCKKNNQSYCFISIPILTFHSILTPPLNQAEFQLTVLADLVSVFSPEGGSKSHTDSATLA